VDVDGGGRMKGMENLVSVLIGVVVGVAVPAVIWYLSRRVDRYAEQLRESPCFFASNGHGMFFDATVEGEKGFMLRPVLELANPSAGIAKGDLLYIELANCGAKPSFVWIHPAPGISEGFLHRQPVGGGSDALFLVYPYDPELMDKHFNISLRITTASGWTIEQAYRYWHGKAYIEFLERRRGGFLVFCGLRAPSTQKEIKSVCRNGNEA